ncbi:hypothetical protein N7466_002358 [Penicillium verhagenii]|uniref:uncharacterized protein n=1 Tax=Penicillium verhagenii TaxID=1562060 RepID=UPI0025458FC4|nr:uncharacterized protein N7466_002358 [Penicillium verhagenii]KAJ5939224.1 hypothetical protein N7466_002358 [Penicillium verhagenii]
MSKGIPSRGLFGSTHGTTVSSLKLLSASIKTDYGSYSSEPEPKIKRSQSVRSNSTSSIASTHPSQVYSAESQALTGYQSPVASVNPGTPNAGDQLMNMCSHCINCQPRLHGTHNNGNQLYSYSPGSGLGLFSSQSSQSGPPPGFEAIDQYLRSVLRPEAFQPLSNPQEQMNSSFWPPNIDPNLSQMNTSNFQHPTSYTWTSGTESLPCHIQPSHQLPQSRASQERNT